MTLWILQFRRFMPVKGSQEAIQKIFFSDVPAWITLGHYDSLQILEPEQTDTTIFEQIEDAQRQLLRDEISEASLIRNLYLFSDEKKIIWYTHYLFLAVVRVHFFQSFALENTRRIFRDDIRRAEEKIEQVMHFQSAGLSDQVILCASDDLKKLVDFALNVREARGAGKTYTYFCINSHCLQDDWTPHEMEPLDFLNICFSVGATQNLDKHLEQVMEILEAEQIYAISGQNDLAVALSKVKPENLIALYQKWFSNKGTPSENWPFTDVTTMLGTEFSSWGGIVRESVEIKRCEVLLQERDQIYQQRFKEEGSLPDWFCQMSNLLNALMNISTSVVMDEFFFLFYPGASAFMEQVKTLYQQGQPLPEDQMNTYLQSWRQLNELVIQNEGQLAVYPELHPHIHSVSFMQLEYIMSFLYLCQDFLKDDEEDSHDVMILPSEIGRIETEEIFRKNDRANGIIVIGIPAQGMRDFGEVLRSLCHEISHFVGEKARMRDNRVDNYAETICAMIAWRLFHYDNPDFIQALAEDTNSAPAGLKKYLVSKLGTSLFTKEAMIRHTTEWIRQCFRAIDVSRRGALLRMLMNCWKEEEQTNIIPADQIMGQEEFDLERNLCEDYGKLYREIFADLCMIKILQPDEREYVNLILNDMRTKRFKRSNVFKGNALLMNAERIYICMLTCDMCFSGLQDSMPDNFLHYMKSVHYTYVTQVTTTPDAPITYHMIEPIVRYARNCAQVLDELIAERVNQVTSIRASYKIIKDKANEASIQDIEQIIDGYRGRVLNNQRDDSHNLVC